MLKLLLASLFAAFSAGVQAAPVHFGLFSDLPYSAWEREQLPLLIAEMNAEPLAFVVHGGDIKNGTSVCSDEAYQAILEAFQSSAHPLIYVPGDNEWTDCHHRQNARFEPVERLEKLRSLFWAGDSTLGRRTMKLERQSDASAFPAYRENVRWEVDGVLFMGLNLPGSENNFFGVTRGTREPRGPVAEFVERSAANRAWLGEAFAIARRKNLPAVLIVAHGNPGFEAWNAGRAETGYLDFLTQLRDEVQAFSGQVVLVHGDTHNQQIDQPLRDAKNGDVIGNFTRVETFGFPHFGWVQGTINLEDPRVFRFSPRPWGRSGRAPLANEPILSNPIGVSRSSL